MTSTESIHNYLEANNYDLTRRDRLAAQLQFDADAVENWYPEPDYSNCYAVDNANALWVSGSLIKKGGTSGVGGTTIRLKGAGLANTTPSWEDTITNVTEILTDDTNYPSLNLVRLPVYGNDWSAMSPAQKDTFWNNVILPCINLCVAAEVYVILDYHSVAAWNDPARISGVKEFGKYFIPKICNNPFVIMELFNEPTTPAVYPWPGTLQNYLDFRTLWQPVLNLWRFLCRNIIIVSSPVYSTRSIYADTHPFEGANLAYTHHSYPNFTGGLRDYLGMPVTAASSTTILSNATPTTVPVFLSELGFASPDVAPGDETNLSNDVNFPEGMLNYLIARKNVHPTIWAHSIFGLGTKNTYGEAMKAWWKDSLPLITT
jgi:hypothetical protein